MKEYMLDCRVVENKKCGDGYALMKFLLPQAIEAIKPGQFAQIEVDNSKTTFLRRPISVCRYNDETCELTMLVRKAGDGTTALMDKKIGDCVNMVLPLGNGFNEAGKKSKLLLIGGGVGVAPLLGLAEKLVKNGHLVEILIGAKTASQLLLVEEFEKLGKVHVSTDDGTAGDKGLVIFNPILQHPENFDKIYCCGPLPMMKGVAKYASQNGIDCEVSLENMMACGLGACLCCVEDIHEKGNVCVCKEGPVFNVKQLKWE